MKDISTMLLVSGFVLFALISLLTAIRSSESARSVLIGNEDKISDLGLRFTLNK